LIVKSVYSSQQHFSTFWQVSFRATRWMLFLVDDYRYWLLHQSNSHRVRAGVFCLSDWEARSSAFLFYFSASVSAALLLLADCLPPLPLIASGLN
jgi:hypothetical protein